MSLFYKNNDYGRAAARNFSEPHSYKPIDHKLNLSTV